MTAATDILKNAWRDYRTAGVPATGQNEPVKAEIRSALDALGGEIEGLTGSVDSVEERINAIEGAQSAGSLAFATKAAMDAVTDKPTNTRATVYQDGTASNNGDYRWTGSAWSYLGADRITKAENAASTVVNLRYPLVYDKDDALGGGSEKLYVSRTLYAKRGASVLSGDYGTASAEIPTHIKLTVQNSLSTVYVDLTDTVNPVKVALWPTLAPVGTNYIILATIQSGAVASDHPVEFATELLTGKVAPRLPLAVDDDKLLIPLFYTYRRRDGAFALHSPADGSYYFEADLSTASNVEGRVWYDQLAHEAGLNPVKSVLGGTAPGVIGRNEYVIPIARTMNRAVSTDLPIHTAYVDSQFLRGNDPDRALLYSAATTLVDVTEAALTSLGITRGVSGDDAFYGGDLPPDLPKKGYYFARVYVQASADNVFQTPQLYVRGGTDTTLGSATMVMEKKISARVAIYLIMGQYSYSSRPSRINIGTFQTTDPVIICGAQVYLGAARLPWIRRGQWPTVGANDLVYGPVMFFVDDQPLPLYPDNLFPSRTPILSIATAKTLPDVDSDIQLQGGNINLRANDLGSSVSLTAISTAERTNVRQKSVDIVKTATPLTGSPKILLLGDSITNRQTGWAIKQMLEDWGLTPTWIGTIPGSDTTAVLDTGGPLGEGRESWATTDYLGSSIADDVTNGVLAVGSEATYTAASKDDKRKYQPFLNPALGAGSAAPIVNVSGTDYRFDMRFYLNRFSLADPDIVAVNIGMNNLLEGYATMLSTVATDLPIIIAEIRRALPSAKIVLWSTTGPYGQVGDGRQREGWSAIQKFLVDHVAALRTGGDANVYLCSAWAHQSPLAGWSIVRGEMSDPTHPAGTARMQHSYALAAAIAGVA